MSKKVYLEPAWKLPACYDHMVNFPPDGYEFVVAPSSQERLFKAVSRWNMSYSLLRFVDKVVPAVLARSWLQRQRRPPPGTALTYAHGHLVFRPEPWVVEVEFAHLLLGFAPKHLGRFQGTLERMLASPYCRKIRCWSEAGRRSLTLGLNSQKFKHKIEVIPMAVPPKTFVKEYGSGKVKLLLVGSGNIKGEWLGRGSGVLEVFALLRHRYDNLELVIRSDLPAEVKAKALGMEGVRIIEKVVPWEMLEREFQMADIFILPSLSTPPFSILDAMSYELPVVSINVWANGEYIEDGKTGLLAKASQKVPYYYHNTSHPNFGSTELPEIIRVSDPQMVGDLAQKIGLLIENPELRRRLGRAGRWEVEHGNFSIGARNEKLKRVFDEATCPVPQKH